MFVRNNMGPIKCLNNGHSSLKQPKGNSSLHLINFEECGHVRESERITKGKTAPLGQYPWVARLGYEMGKNKIRFRCGGSLINKNYILTAAHCVHGWEIELKTIRLGETNLTKANNDEECIENICTPPVQDIGIDKLHIHPNFNRTSVKNDICLIRLAQEAVYNDFVKPICLPHGEIITKNYIAERVEIAGWGVIDSSTEEVSTTLQYVSLPVRDRCACASISSDIHLDDTQFCVGVETGEDSCVGDSGGPMMKMEYSSGANKYYLLG
ncbi:hypothetical protein NQ315_006640, partial [Exocentrus adspersus]